MARRRQSNSSQKNNPVALSESSAGFGAAENSLFTMLKGYVQSTDRVKENLFNWLAQDVPQAKVLDLFAGSGGLGFEAASHQASSVTMLEMNPQAHKQLLANIQTLKTDSIPAHWQLYREKTAGQVCYRLFEREEK
jgi:16S rRNA (guanine966-N2)-methyltransferase